MALVPHLRPQSPRSRLALWLLGKLAELLTVFAGVYAAFLLNTRQIHRDERQHRDQILSWLEKRYAEMRADLGRETSTVRRYGEEFNRQAQAGEMPALHAFLWNTSYSQLDLPGLLQSGGYSLLELETVRSLKDVDDTLRGMVTLALHDQQLSDALILPNLDKHPGAFYDPATRRLRPAFAWYGDFSREMLSRYDELQPELDHVLEQLKAERARNR